MKINFVTIPEIINKGIMLLENEKMTEKNELLDIVIEAINATIKPLDLVVTYILWKDGGEIEEGILEKELNSFIKSITPKILEDMIDTCVERGLLKQDEKGNIIKMG